MKRGTEGMPRQVIILHAVKNTNMVTVSTIEAPMDPWNDADICGAILHSQLSEAAPSHVVTDKSPDYRIFATRWN
jgi:hypothetical protein